MLDERERAILVLALGMFMDEAARRGAKVFLDQMGVWDQPINVGKYTDDYEVARLLRERIRTGEAT